MKPREMPFLAPGLSSMNGATAILLHLFLQNKLSGSDMKYLVSSFSLAVGKGKKNAPWSFLFVDFGISLRSANRYSFFMLL